MRPSLLRACVGPAVTDLVARMVTAPQGHMAGMRERSGTVML